MAGSTPTTAGDLAECTQTAGGGRVFVEYELAPVLCKPKLLPLRTVTQERLERMQHEMRLLAEAAVRRQREAIGAAEEAHGAPGANGAEPQSADGGERPHEDADVGQRHDTDVWRADDDEAEPAGRDAP